MSIPLSIKIGGADATDLTGALESAEVYECIGEPTTYRLRQTIVDKDGDFPALGSDRFGCASVLTLAGWVADAPQILVHGPVHAQEVHFQHGVMNSWMEIVGADETIKMDATVEARVWGDGKVTDAVSSIFTKYGFTPKVDAVEAQFTEKTHSLVQRETDLHFVRKLATRYGRWFWVERTAADTTLAHFAKPTMKAVKPITISINATDHNVDELDLSWDTDRPTQAIAKQTGLPDKKGIDGNVAKSSLEPLGGKAFADIPGARSLKLTAPADSVGDLRARADAALQQAAWFVRLRGKTTVRALGKLLRPYTIAAVQGLGKRHSGNYVVASVRHVLTAAGHAMEFELIRNAWEAA